jgi:hypothetical protein
MREIQDKGWGRNVILNIKWRRFLNAKWRRSLSRSGPVTRSYPEPRSPPFGRAWRCGRLAKVSCVLKAPKSWMLDASDKHSRRCRAGQCSQIESATTTAMPTPIQTMMNLAALCDSAHSPL